MHKACKYTPEIAEIILGRLANGESLDSICRDEMMPSPSSVRRWAQDDINGFAADYARARENQAHALVDEILALPNQEPDPQRLTAVFNVKRWAASKILPKVYGEKLEIDATTRQAVVSAEPTGEEWQAKHGRRP